MATYNIIVPGDPAPWFRQRTTANPNFNFDTIAGRYIVLCFLGSAGDAAGRGAIEAVLAGRRPFDDANICLFGVTVDPADEAEGRLQDSAPGIRHFWDFDGKVSRLYGALPKEEGSAPPDIAAFQRRWVVVDPMLRVLAVVPFTGDGRDSRELLRFLAGLPPPARFAGFELPPPVLILPNVFEPKFCENLIGLYEQHGGEESGFMRETGGKTVLVTDPGHKRRKDYTIEDAQLIRATQQRINRRVVPEILKVHHFKVTRMERYIVSCYAADDGGHFRAHRDNTTKGTAHRRFAVSVNLNADFDGGEVGFPEYGPRRFKPPPGGAVVFSCSLLHQVSRVTRGRRYAFLPFLYDENAARLREANNEFLDEGVGSYSRH